MRLIKTFKKLIFLYLYHHKNGLHPNTNKQHNFSHSMEYLPDQKLLNMVLHK